MVKTASDGGFTNIQKLVSSQEHSWLVKTKDRLLKDTRAKSPHDEERDFLMMLAIEAELELYARGEALAPYIELIDEGIQATK